MALTIERKDFSEPARNANSVTPHDTNDLTYTTRAIYVGGAGNLKVDMVDGNTVTLSSVAASTVLPIAVKRIHSTGTTATAIIALW